MVGSSIAPSFQSINVKEGDCFRQVKPKYQILKTMHAKIFVKISHSPAAPVEAGWSLDFLEAMAASYINVRYGS